MRYLSSIGKSDVAYQLATTDTYPGWGYMVKMEPLPSGNYGMATQPTLP